MEPQANTPLYGTRGDHHRRVCAKMMEVISGTGGDGGKRSSTHISTLTFDAP